MNLFLTVGTQLPFDRLTRAVDDWLEDNPDHAPKVFGQIGPVGGTNYLPRNFDWVEFLSPEEFGVRFEGASHVVAHAGMGTIISAMVAGKPITILPRRAALGEQRNDHQIATVRNFQTKPGVQVAADEGDVSNAIDTMLGAGDSAGAARAKQFADTALTDAIRAEIMA